MRSNFYEGELIVFSDGLKVLVLQSFDYEGKAYIYVKRVNETETIAIGDAFFLELITDNDDFECKYVKNAEHIYALMSEMKMSQV